MADIGVDPSLSNNSLYEHICMENIKFFTNLLINVMANISIKLFLKQQWSPPLNNSPTKAHFHLINLSLLKTNSDVLDIKQKADVLRLGAAKSKYRAIISGNTLWSIISKYCGHTKNKPTGQISPLQLYSTPTPGFTISNRKLFYLCLHLWYIEETNSNKFVIAGAFTRTSKYHGVSNRKRWT